MTNLEKLLQWDLESRSSWCGVLENISWDEQNNLGKEFENWHRDLNKVLKSSMEAFSKLLFWITLISVFWSWLMDSRPSLVPCSFITDDITVPKWKINGEIKINFVFLCTQIKINTSKLYWICNEKMLGCSANITSNGVNSNIFLFNSLRVGFFFTSLHYSDYPLSLLTSSPPGH